MKEGWSGMLRVVFFLAWFCAACPGYARQTGMEKIPCGASLHGRDEGRPVNAPLPACPGASGGLGQEAHLPAGPQAVQWEIVDSCTIILVVYTVGFWLIQLRRVLPRKPG